MAVKDLRDRLARVDEIGEPKRVDGANLEEEIGTLYELSWERKDLPTILFDKIPGFCPGYRIATTAPSPRTTALTLGCPPGPRC